VTLVPQILFLLAVAKAKSVLEKRRVLAGKSLGIKLAKCHDADV
jgi:hypothetical protein